MSNLTLLSDFFLETVEGVKTKMIHASSYVLVLPLKNSNASKTVNM